MRSIDYRASLRERLHELLGVSTSGEPIVHDAWLDVAILFTHENLAGALHAEGRGGGRFIPHLADPTILPWPGTVAWPIEFDDAQIGLVIVWPDQHTIFSVPPNYAGVWAPGFWPRGSGDARQLWDGGSWAFGVWHHETRRIQVSPGVSGEGEGLATAPYRQPAAKWPEWHDGTSTLDDLAGWGRRGGSRRRVSSQRSLLWLCARCAADREGDAREQPVEARDGEAAGVLPIAMSMG